MFNKSSPKVKFQDQQLDDYVLEVNYITQFPTQYKLSLFWNILSNQNYYPKKINIQ